MKQTALTLIMLLCLTTTVWAGGDNAQKRKQKKNQWTEIRNGEVWTDTDGNIVQAHAPGFLKQGDTWYMVGEDRGQSFNPDVSDVSLSILSTTNLLDWTHAVEFQLPGPPFDFNGMILQHADTAPARFYKLKVH